MYSKEILCFGRRRRNVSKINKVFFKEVTVIFLKTDSVLLLSSHTSKVHRYYQSVRLRPQFRTFSLKVYIERKYIFHFLYSIRKCKFMDFSMKIENEVTLQKIIIIKLLKVKLILRVKT